MGAQARARSHTQAHPPPTDAPEGPVPADGEGLKILPVLSGLSHFESRPVPLGKMRASGSLGRLYGWNLKSQQQ